MFKYLIYKRVNLPGGSGELVAGFVNLADAEKFLKIYGESYYIKSV